LPLLSSEWALCNWTRKKNVQMEQKSR